MKLKLIKNGREVFCTKQVWDSFSFENKRLWEVIEEEKEVKILMRLREKNTNAN